MTGGMRVTYKGYRHYVRQLQGEAGLVDVELEDMVDKLRDTDRKMTKLERVMGALND